MKKIGVKKDGWQSTVERNYRAKGKAANDRPSKLGEHKWE